MTLDDESLLTAYLDGELAPDQRSSIESALLADPGLADGLRRLVEVRELLAGMPRPSIPVDLAGAVVGHLRNDASREVLRGPSAWPPLRPARLAAGLGLAATVLVALTFALKGPKPVRAPGPATPRPPVVAETRPGRAGADRRGPAIDLPRVAAATPGTADGRGPVSEDEAQRASEAEQVREMLDSPRLRRIFIVTDVLGGTGRDTVEELVRKTPRTEASYGRITVSQGIVIDPRHPNEATVFALVMNEQEQRNFQKRLEESFPKVEDASVDPEVVTQLVDIGQMAVLPGSPASEVVIPDDVSPQVALRAVPAPRAPQVEKDRISPEIDLARLSEAGNLKISERPQGAEEKKEGDAGEEAGPKATGEATMLIRKEERPPSAEPGDEKGATGLVPEESSKPRRFRDPPAIVLVWVTRP